MLLLTYACVRRAFALGTAITLASTTIGMSPTGPIGQCTESKLAKIDLGDAARFAILATTAVTDAGGSQINGDMGTTGTSLPFYPPYITGIPGLKGTLPYAEGTKGLHNKDKTSLAAWIAAVDAWNVIKGHYDCETGLGGIVELGGRTLTPGLYTSTIAFHGECIRALYLTYPTPDTTTLVRIQLNLSILQQ